MLKVFKRRIISIPLYFLVLVLYLVFFPFTVITAFLIDIFLNKKFSVSRTVIFMLIYLSAEFAGIIISFIIWLFSLFHSEKNWFRLQNFKLQCKWTRFLAYISFGLYGLRIETEGEKEIGEGPIIVFIRHSSVADTILPAIFIAEPNNIILRYVLKKELLWDPCLDIVGNRLRNYFVNRDSDNNTAEIREVGLLANDIQKGEGVIIYPEGTRFSKTKYEKIIDKFKKSGDEKMLEKVSVFKNVLPPRLGGPLELLKNNKNADIIFCSHTGLEGSSSFKELINGKLINETIRIKFWKIPFSEIPKDRNEQIDWLYKNWELVDEFVKGD